MLDLKMGIGIMLLIYLCCLCNISFAAKVGDFSAKVGDEVFLKADSIYYDSKNTTFKATGNVAIQVDDYILRANSLEYNTTTDQIKADEEVTITDNNGRILHGEKVILKNKLKQGIIEQFTALLENDMIFVSDKAERLSENEFLLQKSVFTSCKVYCKSSPIWQIKSEQTNIDYAKENITNKHAFFEVFGYPILYIPYFRYPIPDTGSHSGILMPSLNKNDLSVPLYYSVKSNIDMTLTPRISTHYTILGVEYRHKLPYGEYNLSGDFGNPQDNDDDNDQINKNRRFHFFPKGDFTANNYHFGFDINVASDKAYLTNYHNIYDPYLTSLLYVRQIDHRNYISTEALLFQDLRDDSRAKTSIVTPSIETHHTLPLNQEESYLFDVESNSFLYGDEDDLKVTKSSVNFELAYYQFLNNGQVIDYHLGNRLDAYWSSHNNNQQHTESFSSISNTPEIGIKWRYPFISYHHNYNILFEPNFSWIWNEKLNNTNNQHLLDLHSTEISENNLFDYKQLNIFKESDGMYFSYGVNSSVNLDNLYLGGFIGQIYHDPKLNKMENFEYIGNTSMTFNDQLSFFYRFHKDKKFKSIRNEFDIISNHDKLKINIGLAELKKASQYYENFDKGFIQDQITQLSAYGSYELFHNFWLGGGIRTNIDHGASDILSRTIRLTYLYDCVNIGFKINDDFMQDQSRGVKNTRHKSLILELKSLNM